MVGPTSYALLISWENFRLLSSRSLMNSKPADQFRRKRYERPKSAFTPVSPRHMQVVLGDRRRYSGAYVKLKPSTNRSSRKFFCRMSLASGSTNPDPIVGSTYRATPTQCV